MYTCICIYKLFICIYKCTYMYVYVHTYMYSMYLCCFVYCYCTLCDHVSKYVRTSNSALMEVFVVLYSTYIGPNLGHGSSLETQGYPILLHNARASMTTNNMLRYV